MGLSDGVFGVGVDRDSLAASLRAILSAANAAIRPEGASTAATAQAIKNEVKSNGISTGQLPDATKVPQAHTNGLDSVAGGV